MNNTDREKALTKYLKAQDIKIKALTKKANTFEGCYNGLKFKYDEQVKEIEELRESLRILNLLYDDLFKAAKKVIIPNH